MGLQVLASVVRRGEVWMGLIESRLASVMRRGEVWMGFKTCKVLQVLCEEERFAWGGRI